MGIIVLPCVVVRLYSWSNHGGNGISCISCRLFPAPSLEFGTLHHLQLLEDKPDFQIMTVVFGEPISRIDRSVFEDVETWGTCSLQGWVNSYESVRCVAINDHTKVIRGEIQLIENGKQPPLLSSMSLPAGEESNKEALFMSYK